MRRLTKRQHESLQRLVRTDMPIRAIAIQAEVSIGTVIGFQKAYDVVDILSEQSKEKIRRLLWMKTPVPQISAMLKIPKRDISSLRKLDRFREQPSDGVECVECGTRFFAPAEPQDTPARKFPLDDCKLSQENFTALLKVVCDVMALSDLQFVTHPLFYHLSKRAEKAYQACQRKSEK
jgi:hypothetical protein